MEDDRRCNMSWTENVLSDVSIFAGDVMTTDIMYSSPHWLRDDDMVTNTVHFEEDSFEDGISCGYDSGDNCDLKGDFMQVSNPSHHLFEPTSDELGWRRVTSSLGVDKSPLELGRDDIVGKLFKSLEDAEYFFTEYARLTGFSVRKGHMRMRRNGKLMLREWKCSREGHRQAKFLKMCNRTREARPMTRVGCKVTFRVVQKKHSNSYVVKEFITEHSHKLTAPHHLQFLRSNRVVPGGDLQVARSMKAAGIRTCQIMSLFAQQSGGYEKIRYIIKDLYNHIGSSDSMQLWDSDAARAIGNFEHKADHDSGFFGKYSYDDMGRLGNVVWADSRCKADYSLFGHAIAFDTTYRTNGYEKPLLIWIGINRHFKTTIMGFAILIDETVATYKWVTEAFIECMDGVLPKTVVTDGDPAIRAVIVELMPNTKHRLCSWHIQRNATSNVKDPSFLPRMKKMIYRYYTVEDFEKEWSKMVHDFGLQGNIWIRQMYDKRKTWAETYLRGLFFVGMATTQRSEGINALLKKRLTQKLKLWEFVRSIDLALSWLRHKEAKDDYDTLNTKPMLKRTNMNEIENQAADVYIRRIFYKVRDQIAKEGKYIVTTSRVDEDAIYYQLTKYQQEQCKRTVKMMPKGDIYHCGCNYFPTFGIPCRHIFATMKYRHVKSIPDSMIVSQWTINGESIAMKEGYYAPKCRYTCSEQSARFDVLGRLTNNIRFVAAKNSNLFKKAVAEMSNIHTFLVQEFQCQGDMVDEIGNIERQKVEIKNPLVSKTKGTAGAKGRPGGGKKKCSHCQKYGHNRATCIRRTTKRNGELDQTIDFDEDKDDNVNMGDDNYPWSSPHENENDFNSSYVKESSPLTHQKVNGSSEGLIRMVEKMPLYGNEEEETSLYENALFSDEAYKSWWGTPYSD